MPLRAFAVAAVSRWHLPLVAVLALAGGHALGALLVRAAPPPSSADGRVFDAHGVRVRPRVLALPDSPDRRPDCVWGPTPLRVVDRMLELAGVKKSDLVYDLGCGDGRIVVAAARKYGCRAVGFDIDRLRVQESRDNVRKHKLERLVDIKKHDIYKLDLSEATVITLSLLPVMNVKLVPQLQKMKPGSRIVSLNFDIQGYRHDKMITVEGDFREDTVYLWTIPLTKGEPSP